MFILIFSISILKLLIAQSITFSFSAKLKAHVEYNIVPLILQRLIALEINFFCISTSSFCIFRDQYSYVFLFDTINLPSPLQGASTKILSKLLALLNSCVPSLFMMCTILAPCFSTLYLSFSHLNLSISFAKI